MISVSKNEGECGVEAKENTLISVIVPVYNAEEWMRESLESIRAQSYKNLEVLLIDDGSTDGSGAICDEYAAMDGRFVAIHKENGGVSSARNVGLDRASGAWIGFVDPDDIARPELFARLLREAEASDSDIVACGFHRFGEENNDRTFPAGRFDTREALLRMTLGEKLNVHLWNKIYRRELFDGILFPEGQISEDLLVMHRLFERAKQVSVIEDILYDYRVRGGSLSQAMRGRFARERIWGRELRAELLRGTEYYPNACIYVLYCIREDILQMLEPGGGWGDDREFCREIVKKGRKLLRQYGNRLSRRARVHYFLLLLSPKLFCRLRGLRKK